MTRQEILNTVWHHLFTQGEPAVMGYHFQCRYRVAGTKLKCAVGCLIPDELYSEEMEGGIDNLVEHRERFKLPEWFETELNLLADLQLVHDNCSFEKGRFNFTELRNRLERVANEYNLEIPKGEQT